MHIMAVKIDLSGKRFGELTVLSLVDDRPGKKKKWLCQCDCGERTVVAASNLHSGHTQHCKKCGNKVNANKRKKHGMTHTKLYYVWRGMLNRCYNAKSKSYGDYGARGIKVSDEWHDPVAFFEWAKNSGYHEGLEIDRIDTNGDYSEQNCRWITRKANANNKRNNTIVEYHGEQHTLAQWAGIYGINYKNLSRNLKKGMSFEAAIFRGIAQAAPKEPTLFGEEE